MTDPNQGVTTYCYTPSTLQVGNVFDPLGHERSSSYTPDENVSKLTDPLTNLTTFNWSADGKNNLTGVTDATSASTTFGYGTTNPYLPTSSTTPQGTQLAYTYDTPGNVQTVKNTTGGKDNLVDSYTYNTSPAALIGTLATATNADNDATTFGYDSAGNLSSVTPPANGVLGATTLTYDGVSRVKSVTDGKGQTTTFAYDKDDRIKTITYNDTSTVSYVYDANGNVKSETDANGTTSFTYDQDNRELTKQQPQPNGYSFTYGYGPRGNLTSLADPNGTVSYTYDAAGRLTSLTEPDGTSTTTFGYDNADQRTSTVYPNGVTQTITYDAAGRELSVVGKNSKGALLTSFTYCYVPLQAGSCPKTGPSPAVPSTNLRDALIDGVALTTTTYSYDTRDRMDEALTTTTNGGTTVSDFKYNYDAASNLLGQTDTVGGTTTTVTYTVDPDNAVTSETTNGVTEPFTYDKDGNLLTWASGTGAAWDLDYNAKNQMTEGTVGSGTDPSQSYTYSGPDQQEVLSATDGSNTIQFANSALGETYQAESASDFQAFARDDRGALVSRSAATGSYQYYLFDGLGSVVGLTDSSGNIVQSYAYDPYGNVTASSGSVVNPFQYASGWTSSKTGYSHFGARWYAPQTNYTRWTQQDPIAGSLFDPTSQCRYAYASDDPINLTDASGEQSLCIGGPGGLCLNACDISFGIFTGLSCGVFGGFLAGLLCLVAGAILGGASFSHQPISNYFCQAIVEAIQQYLSHPFPLPIA